MKGKHRHIDPKDVQKCTLPVNEGSDYIPMDIKLNDHFNYLMDKLSEHQIKSLDRVNSLNALCNLLASDHDYYDLVVNNCQTICDIVKEIMTPQESKLTQEYVAANRLYCFTCMILGPDNDYVLQQMFPTFTDMLYFAYYPVEVQLIILQTIGLCTLVCSSMVDHLASDFCFYIFNMLPMSDSATALNHDNALKLGALHCWSILASRNSKEDVCEHAEKIILDMLALLMDSPNINVVKLCGTVLAGIQEVSVECGLSEAYDAHMDHHHHVRDTEPSVLASGSIDIYDCISVFNHSMKQFAVDKEHVLSRISEYLNSGVKYHEQLAVHGGVITIHSFRVKAVMNVVRDIFHMRFKCILRSFPNIVDIVGMENIEFVPLKFADDLPPSTSDENYFIEHKHALQLEHQHAQEIKELGRMKQEHPTVGILPVYTTSTEETTARPHHRKGRDNCYHLAASKHGRSHIKHMIYGTYFAPKT